MLIRYKSYIGSTRYKVRNSYYQGKGTFVAGVVSNDLSLVEDISAHRNVSCFSGRFSTSGSITVQASGGVAPYIYSMDSNFSTYNSTGVFDDLFITGPITESTDEYGDIIICTKTIYAKDSSNHTASIDVQLQSPGELNFRTFPNDVVLYCDEGQNYATYECDPPTLTTYANNPTFNITVSGALSSNSLPADGHYPVGVTTIRYRIDDRICRATPAARQYTVTVLPELTLSEDISMHHNVTCFDGSDGSITVIASGGAAPYMYSMDSSFSTYNTTGVFDNLFITGPITEGTDEFGGILICTKTIYVKDANNVVSHLDVTLKSPVNYEWLNVPEPIVVFSDPGQSYATVSFTEPHLSTTANGITQRFSMTSNPSTTVDPYNPGQYPVGTYVLSYVAKITTPCRKQTVANVSITVLSRVTLTEVTADHHDVTCFDGGDGSITVQASGGVGPYQYSIDGTNWQNSQTFSNLSITGPVTESTDQYGGILICNKTIYVKDSYNNISSVDVQLKSPVELEWLNCPDNIVVYCDEGEDYATVVPEVDFIEPTPSTTANFLPGRSISINGKHSDNIYRFDNSPYTIQYRVANSCREQDMCVFTITVLPELTLAEDISAHHDVTCFDGFDGSITVIASGGEAPYIYSLDSNFSTYNTTGVFTDLSVNGSIEEGTDQYGGIVICYKTIYARDANGRIAHLDVRLQSPVELEILGCPDDITVYCDSGQTYATVVWTAYLSTTANNGHITNISNVMQDNHYPIGETIITYSGQNSRLCGERANCTFTITVLPELTLSEDTSVHQNVTCFNRNNGSITVQASGGVSPYLYSIDGTNWQSSPTFSNLSITGPITEGTDQYGGILICTKTIYVKDANDHVESINVQLKSPVEFGWDTFPDDIVVFCDPGENYATVIFDEPTLTTYHNNASISHGDYPTNNQYPIGNTRITYRVINGCKPSTFPSKTLSITVLHPYYQNAIQDYDGNWYDAVVIGEQVWLAQNLRTTHYADGTPISNGGNNQSDTIPYYYDYSTPNIPLNLRGYLYNWPAVMNGAPSSSTNPSGVQGIAPSGWHIPSYNELYQLDEYVGNQSIYNYNNQDGKNAKALAYDNYWYNSSVLGSPGNDQTSNNATMFGVIPAGYMYSAGNFSSATTRGYLWSSTKTTTTVSIYAENHTVDMFSSSGLNAYYGASVRCVCDMTPLGFVTWYYNQYGSYNHQLS